jgi:signal transduction histidine kinase
MGNLPLIELAAYNNLAYCYMDKGNINKAIECLVEKSIPIAKKNKYLNQLATLFDTYADVLLAKGEIRAAFDALRESILYQTKFNSIKKEDQIRLLASILELKNKEETIKVKESEIIQKNIQNQILKLIIVISVLITIILIFLYLGIRQKTNLKFKQQQINSARHIIELEETEKSRIGFELHDNFGYLLKVTDGFINSLKIEDEKIKEDLLGKMKELSDTVRRISHRVNLIKDDQTPLQDIISEIVNDMKFFTGINVSFYIPDQIPEFSKELKLHICRIVQELLTNASKYARNSRIQIDIVINENILLINYLDEGPGFDTDRIKGGGIGIGSIYERISLLGGNVKLDSSVGHETKWRITIPI